jgi:hypothetical protein
VCRCVPFIQKAMKLDEIVSVRDIRSVVKEKFKEYKDVKDQRVGGWLRSSDGAGRRPDMTQGWSHRMQRKADRHGDLGVAGRQEAAASHEVAAVHLPGWVCSAVGRRR